METDTHAHRNKQGNMLHSDTQTIEKIKTINKIKDRQDLHYSLSKALNKEKWPYGCVGGTNRRGLVYVVDMLRLFSMIMIWAE